MYGVFVARAIGVKDGCCKGSLAHGILSEVTFLVNLICMIPLCSMYQLLQVLFDDKYFAVMDVCL